jgi:hypothetical protein
MANESEHGWSEPRVAAFFRAHPERAPRTSSWVSQGWDEPVANALAELLVIELASGIAIHVTQIKEKFGGLRIYVAVDEDSIGQFEVVKSTVASTHFRNAATPGSVRERAHAIVDQAAERAEQCCIRCGASATHQDGYYSVCDAHRHRNRKAT